MYSIDQGVNEKFFLVFFFCGYSLLAGIQTLHSNVLIFKYCSKLIC